MQSRLAEQACRNEPMGRLIKRRLTPPFQATPGRSGGEVPAWRPRPVAEEEFHQPAPGFPLASASRYRSDRTSLRFDCGPAPRIPDAARRRPLRPDPPKLRPSRSNPREEALSRSRQAADHHGTKAGKAVKFPTRLLHFRRKPNRERQTFVTPDHWRTVPCLSAQTRNRPVLSASPAQVQLTFVTNPL